MLVHLPYSRQVNCCLKQFNSSSSTPRHTASPASLTEGGIRGGGRGRWWWCWGARGLWQSEVKGMRERRGSLREIRRDRSGGRGRELRQGPRLLSLPTHIHVSPHRVANSAAHAPWRCQNIYRDGWLEFACAAVMCFFFFEQDYSPITAWNMCASINGQYIYVKVHY